MSDVLEQAVEEAAKLRAKLCQQCTTQDDIIAVATAFLTEAIHIHRTLGSDDIAAQILYSRADSLATGQYPKNEP